MFGLQRSVHKESIFTRGKNVEPKPWNKKSKKEKSIWKNILEMIMGQQGKKYIRERRINGKPGDLGKSKGQSFIKENR